MDSSEGFLPFDEFRPKKIQQFETDLEAIFRIGEIKDERDIIRQCINAGMTCSRAEPVIKKLKTAGLLECEFRTPIIGNWSKPRPLRISLVKRSSL